MRYDEGLSEKAVQRILQRVMATRLRALGWTAISGLLAMLFAPLSYVLGWQCVSGGLVGLATLRQGPREGAVLIAGASVLLVIVSFAMFGSVAPALALGGFLWLPAWLMSAALRVTSNPGWVLGGTALVLGLAVLGFRLAVGDPGDWWTRFWQQRLVPAGVAAPEGGGVERTGRVPGGADLRAGEGIAPRGGRVPPPAPRGRGSRVDAPRAPSGDGEGRHLLEGILQVLETWAPITTGILGTGLLLLSALTMFLARWGHAILDNPGGFGREFRSLRLPLPAAYVTLAAGALMMLSKGSAGQAATEWVMMLLVLYLLQGLAIVHALVHALALPRGWLVLLYVVLLLLPVSSIAAMVLATIGFSDTWIRYRARFRPRT